MEIYVTLIGKTNNNNKDESRSGHTLLLCFHLSKQTHAKRVSTRCIREHSLGLAERTSSSPINKRATPLLYVAKSVKGQVNNPRALIPDLC